MVFNMASVRHLEFGNFWIFLTFSSPCSIFASTYQIYLTPSHSGLFAVKIRSVGAIVIEASCFTSEYSIHPQRFWTSLLLRESSEIRRWKPNARSRGPSMQKKRMRYCLKFCPQNERASQAGCLSPKFYRHWMLQSQSTCLFSVWLCPQWQRFLKTVGRVECSALDTNSRNIWWRWQFWANRGRLRMQWSWICHKAPQRHVEVFHPSFVTDTVHNVLETRTVLQCLPTHFFVGDHRDNFKIQ